MAGDREAGTVTAGSLRPPFLTVVAKHPSGSERQSDDPRTPRPDRAGRDTDWSILMARVQDGDGTAYRRLLQEITPYLRSLAGRRHRDPGDVEDAVQDILLTLHVLRHTYDPLRPFGPWIVAIANRRLIDRLRRQSRLRTRETPLTAAHDAFAAAPSRAEDACDRNRIEAAVDSLPSGQRQAIRMLKLREMSLREASVASGSSVTSLKVATHRGLKALRRLLSDRSET